MIEFTRIFYIAFGLITIAAAVQGMLAGSVVSLIAGGILGALILAGGFMLPTNTTVALILALVGSLGIAGRFVPVFLKTHGIWPAGILALLGAVSIVLTVLVFVKK